MNFPVFDLHCDTALALLGKDMKTPGELKQNNHHVDLERASKLGGYCQCFACFTTPYMTKWSGVSPEVVFERELEGIMRQIEINEDMISLAFCAEDVEENQRNGKMSAILTIEGPAGFGYDPEMLPMLYKAGFRITSLGWNESNPLTGSHVTKEGLTDLGRQYVKKAQELGMIIDVSHISDQGFWDIMEITQGPVIATHSNSRVVRDVTRNLTDDMFKAICATGGVAGLNMCDDFIGENPTLDTACDHILHFLELDPSGKHIALGGDLDGVDKMPAGFDGVQSFPALAQRLLERGVSEETVYDIFWNNALGVMKRAVCNHTR